MTQQEFQAQVTRIEKQFAPFPYGVERTAILWKLVGHFSGEWFKRTVDEKLGTFRQVPLPADFNEDVSLEREKLYQKEKEQNRKDAENFFNQGWGSYPDDERSEIIKKITDRAMGRMNDDHWVSFTSSLDRVANLSKK